MGQTRARGYTTRPMKEPTKELVDKVIQILLEYEDYLPLTIRQVFYRLVARYLFEKTERAYKRLAETINTARRAGLIPFEHIRDDGTQLYKDETFANSAHWLALKKREAQSFRLDRQIGQPVHLFVIAEAQGVAPMLAGVANPYGISVRSSGGFDSTTTKEAFACELAEIAEMGDETEILHLGDFDPSGEHIFSSLREDVLAFFPRHSDGPVPIFTRLAVTLDQIETYNLPTAPAKETDNRRFSGSATVQLESLDPRDLTTILRNAIEERRNPDTLRSILAHEARERKSLISRLSDGEGAA